MWLFVAIVIGSILGYFMLKTPSLMYYALGILLVINLYLIARSGLFPLRMSEVKA